MSGFLNPYAAPQSDLTPPQRWADESPDALGKLRAGLTMVYFGICAGIALTTITFLLSAATMWDGGFPTQLIWLLGGAGLAALPVVASLAMGQVHCLQVPRESRARECLLISMVFQLLAILYVAGHIAASAVWMTPPTAISLLVAGALPLAALGTFVLFERRVAVYLDRDDLVSHARGITGWGLLALLSLAAAIYAHHYHSHGMSVLTFYVAAALLLLITLVSTANLVTYLRTAITSLPSAVENPPPKQHDERNGIDHQDS